MIHPSIFAAEQLKPEIVARLMFGEQAINQSQLEAINAEIKRQHEEWADECERLAVQAQDAGTDLVLEDFMPALHGFEPIIEQPEVRGELAGVTYQIFWDSEGMCVTIERSPFVNMDGQARYTAPPNWMVGHVTRPTQFQPHGSEP